MCDGCLSNTYLVADSPAATRLLVDAGGPIGRCSQGRPARPHVTPRPADPPPLRPRRRARRGSSALPGRRVLIHPRERGSCRRRRASSLPDQELEIGGLEVRAAAHARPHRRDALAARRRHRRVHRRHAVQGLGRRRARARGTRRYDDLKHSIMDVLLALPPETTIHPGHTDPTTVGDELETNAFVRIWRGRRSRRAPSRAPRWASRRRWSCSATTTTAGTRRGSAGPTARDDIVPGSQVSLA